MKTLTVVIPVYNEEKRIHLAFNAVNKLKNPRGVRVEKIVFVNDGSRDNTLAMLNKYKQEKQGKLPSGASIEIVSYAKNRGKGYALKRGMRRVESDYGLIIDADMSIPFANLKTFVPHMESNTDVLVGSKRLASSVSLVKRSLPRKVFGWGYSFLVRRVLGLPLADVTGGFKIYSRRACKTVYPRITQERWSFDPEVLYVANKLVYSIIELPIVWKHVDSSKVGVLRDVTRGLYEILIIKINDLKGIYCLPKPRFSPSLLIEKVYLYTKS